MRPPTRLAGLVVLALAFAGCHADQPSTVPPITSTSSAPASSPASTPESPSPSAVPSSPSATPSASPTATTPPAAEDTHFYANLTPYAAPQTPDASRPGSGYRVVFAEFISRHGSRSLTSSTDARRALALWQRADRADALTARGRDFGPAVRKLTAAMTKIGYGELSARGEREQRGLGQREGSRLDEYFDRAVDDGDQVTVINSGVHRTETSGASFVAGLKREQPRLKVRPQQTERDLHFGSRDPAYLRFVNSNTQWRAAYEKAVAPIGLRAVAVTSLRRIYSADFVRTITDPVAEARAVWEVYRVQPAMSDDVKVDLSPFMDDKTAAAFALDQDAQWFYSRGPGVAGSKFPRQAADPLLREFVTAADRRLAGGSTAAVYRFAHDTELAPFAARLNLPNSRQLPSRSAVYTWQDSTFRVASVAPLSGNIEWTLWRSGRDVLVQVRQNEVPTRLGPSCQVKIETGLYYTWSEAKRCLG